MNNPNPLIPKNDDLGLIFYQKKILLKRLFAILIEIVNGLLQHLLKQVYGVVDIIFLRGFRVYFLHFSLLFGIVQPIVDGTGQILGIAGFEETAAVKGKLSGGREVAVGNDRHKAGGESFNTGDSL